MSAIGRMYRAPFAAVTVSAAQDLFEIVAPSDAVVELVGFQVGQTSDYGDAAAEGLAILVKTGATTSGSGGSSVTPTPGEKGSPAFGGTVEANNTTKASGGTIVTHLSRVLNIQAGLDVMLTPEETVVLSPSERMTIELVAAPADALTMNGEAIFREIGG